MRSGARSSDLLEEKRPIEEREGEMSGIVGLRLLQTGVSGRPRNSVGESKVTRETLATNESMKYQLSAKFLQLLNSLLR